jgi:hypothetical protein
MFQCSKSTFIATTQASCTQTIIPQRQIEIKIGLQETLEWKQRGFGGFHLRRVDGDRKKHKTEKKKKSRGGSKSRFGTGRSRSTLTETSRTTKGGRWQRPRSLVGGAAVPQPSGSRPPERRWRPERKKPTAPHHHHTNTAGHSMRHSGEDGARGGRRRQQGRRAAYKGSGFRRGGAREEVSWFPREPARATAAATLKLPARGRRESGSKEMNPRSVPPDAGERVRFAHAEPSR